MGTSIIITITITIIIIIIIIIIANFSSFYSIHFFYLPFSTPPKLLLFFYFSFLTRLILTFIYGQYEKKIWNDIEYYPFSLPFLSILLFLYCETKRKKKKKSFFFLQIFYNPAYYIYIFPRIRKKLLFNN